MTTSPLRTSARLALAAFYGVAGVLHLAMADAFLAIMPPAIPFASAVVLATGVAEVAGALGLLTARFRRAAGIALALYALAVWPANLHHALNAEAIGLISTSWWYHGPRLALQPALIWLAWWVSGDVSGRVP